jgi:aerobic carbon-monoxide dehydrogenase medium subunit
MNGGVIESIRIGMCGVGNKTLRATGAEEMLTGERPGPDVHKRAGNIAAEECDPIDDAKGTPEYKRDLVRVLLGRTVARAVERAEVQS